MILRGLTDEQAAKIRTIIYEPQWRLYSVPSLNEWLSSLGFRVTPGSDTVLAQH